MVFIYARRGICCFCSPRQNRVVGENGRRILSLLVLAQRRALMEHCCLQQKSSAAAKWNNTEQLLPFFCTYFCTKQAYILPLCRPMLDTFLVLLSQIHDGAEQIKMSTPACVFALHCCYYLSGSPWFFGCLSCVAWMGSDAGRGGLSVEKQDAWMMKSRKLRTLFYARYTIAFYFVIVYKIFNSFNYLKNYDV